MILHSVSDPKPAGDLPTHRELDMSESHSASRRRIAIGGLGQQKAIQPTRGNPMAHKSDIEIARAALKKPIMEIGEGLGIPSEHLLPYGHDKAKVSQEFINSVQGNANGKLVLVTAINPTPAGEGKTTTTVGLGDGLNAIGKKAM
ncbi:MAG TPA: formate--tetrahydrofolate ligase, partial [Roseovarius sp.]|nr:formate--tetrahydrofolate ligase [Roseovarius sp.]